MKSVKLFQKKSGNYSIVSGTTLIGEYQTSDEMMVKINELKAKHGFRLRQPVQLIFAEYSKSQRKNSLQSVLRKDIDKLFK